ncbi:SET domain-containing protein, partial [Coprinellus micaceus]
MKPSQENYTPSHQGLIVKFQPGDFRSALVATRSFGPGELVARLEGLTRGPKRYTSVQCGTGAKDHVELNSDLVFINHSCDPNVAFDLSSRDPNNWHLRTLKPIKAGKPLGFFYPSTEWDMDQPFKCECGAKSCLGSIQGAKYLSLKQLAARDFVNSYILELVSERDGSRLQARL